MNWAEKDWEARKENRRIALKRLDAREQRLAQPDPDDFNSYRDALTAASNALLNERIAYDIVARIRQKEAR